MRKPHVGGCTGWVKCLCGMNWEIQTPLSSPIVCECGKSIEVKLILDGYESVHMVNLPAPVVTEDDMDPDEEARKQRYSG